MLRSTQQQRNLDSYSIAILNQAYHNCHRKDDAPPYEDTAIFMPHPGIWKLFTSSNQLDITREGALEFLQTYQNFDSEVMVVFDPWLLDIQTRAGL